MPQYAAAPPKPPYMGGPSAQQSVPPYGRGAPGIAHFQVLPITNSFTHNLQGWADQEWVKEPGRPWVDQWEQVEWVEEWDLEWEHHQQWEEEVGKLWEYNQGWHR